MKAGWLSSIFLSFFVLNGGFNLAWASQQTKQELDQVKRQIKNQQQQIQLTEKQRQEINAQLRIDELAIADSAAKLNQAQQQRKHTQQRLTELNLQQKKLQKEKAKQEEVLADQLRSAYSTGQHDYLKMLLNQQQPSEVQRTLTYYKYLNEARVNSIEAFEKILTELAEVEAQQREQAQKLVAIEETLIQEQKALEQNKQARKATLAKLNSKLLSDQQKLTLLEQEEQSLVATLARIQAQIKKDLQFKGLSKLKNKLKWPVKGKILNKYNSKKQGYLRWKGVLLDAKLGTNVNAIHNGTVLFSDWLKGYGLVTVLDHGDGYMSLYGHNQTLLKKVGDRVEIGEPIALAGQSGGQSKVGVYFEIRHKGKPVNPQTWCR